MSSTIVTTSLVNLGGERDHHTVLSEAAKAGATLCKYADPTEGAREDLTVDEACDIAAEDPSLIYVTGSGCVTVVVPADEDEDDCLAAAADAYIVDHPALDGYDLDPRWTDDSERERVSLTVPLWALAPIEDEDEDEDEGPETYEEAAELFEAEFGRRPDVDDGDKGELWSHVCAARSAKE